MRTDLQLNTNGDLLVVAGNLVIGESDEQHIIDILSAYPGEYKQFPMIGVYIHRTVNGLIDGFIKRDIRINLESDGYVINKIEFTESELNIDAKYSR